MANIAGIYKDNPTAGGTDGTLVSETNPVPFSLHALSNDADTQRLAVRIAEGYTTKGATTIAVIRDPKGRISLSWDENTGYARSISTTAPIGNANVVFYARARCTPTEFTQIFSKSAIAVSCETIKV